MKLKCNFFFHPLVGTVNFFHRPFWSMDPRLGTWLRGYLFKENQWMEFIPLFKGSLRKESLLFLIFPSLLIGIFQFRCIYPEISIHMYMSLLFFENILFWISSKLPKKLYGLYRELLCIFHLNSPVLSILHLLFCFLFLLPFFLPTFMFLPTAVRIHNYLNYLRDQLVLYHVFYCLLFEFFLRTMIFTYINPVQLPDWGNLNLNTVLFVVYI